ncbi:hypothetical protein M0804_013767 [Polistes exclamans]|nr:hypothetical protein M0804_013767 [Polistes exclamans]
MAVAAWKEEELGLTGVTGETGARVRAAIADRLDEWVERPHSISTTFHTTQLMTGHGCFPAFLCRIGKAVSPQCFHCGANVDDADYTLADCPAWISEQDGLVGDLGGGAFLPLRHSQGIPGYAGGMGCIPVFRGARNEGERGCGEREKTEDLGTDTIPVRTHKRARPISYTSSSEDEVIDLTNIDEAVQEVPSVSNMETGRLIDMIIDNIAEAEVRRKTCGNIKGEISGKMKSCHLEIMGVARELQARNRANCGPNIHEFLEQLRAEAKATNNRLKQVEEECTRLRKELRRKDALLEKVSKGEACNTARAATAAASQARSPAEERLIEARKQDDPEGRTMGRVLTELTKSILRIQEELKEVKMGQGSYAQVAARPRVAPPQPTSTPLTTVPDGDGFIEVAIRVCSAYRTVSFDAAIMVAGIIPLDHLVPQLAEVYATLKDAEGPVPSNIRAALGAEARRMAVAAWKKEELDLTGVTGETGARVRAAIADRLDEWVGRPHSIGTTFHATQLMTGHGCFPAYLYGIRRTDSPRCYHCGADRDDAEHTLIECPAWTNARDSLVRELGGGGGVTLPGIVRLSLDTPGAWAAFQSFSGLVMKAKEDAERERERMFLNRRRVYARSQRRVAPRRTPGRGFGQLWRHLARSSAPLSLRRVCMRMHGMCETDQCILGWMVGRCEVQSEKSNRVTKNRVSKIRELCDKLCSSFANCVTPFRNLCIDKSLLLNKGRLSFKQQYILSKRNRFGIKSFVLCDCKTGFVLNCVVYAVSDFDITKMDDKHLGKSAEVLTLLKSYLEKCRHTHLLRYIT